MPIEASVLYITCAISVSDTVDSAYVIHTCTVSLDQGLWFADCNWQKEAMMQ